MCSSQRGPLSTREMMRFVIVSLLYSVGGASKDIFPRIFHEELLKAHDFEALDLDFLRTSSHSSSEQLYVTCGPHNKHQVRVKELADLFGETNVRLAAIDHAAGEACLMVYGQEQKMVQLLGYECRFSAIRILLLNYIINLLAY